MKVNVEMLRVATEIAHGIDGCFMKHNVSMKDGEWLRMVHCTVDVISDEKIEINCNIPFPELTVEISTYGESDDEKHADLVNFMDSEFIIKFYRNDLTIGVFNDSFSECYMNGILSFVEFIIGEYENGGYDFGGDKFIVKQK